MKVSIFLVLVLLSPLAFGQRVISGGHVIKGGHTVGSVVTTPPAMTQNTALLLGTLSKMSQTPTIFPSDSTIQLGSGPAGLMSGWNSAVYRDLVHQMIIKIAGGHNDYGGNEGYALDISASGGTFSGTWHRLQVSGVDDTPTLPIDMNIASVGNFSLPASGGANCVDNGTTHDNCKAGPRHQYTGVGYIPPGAVNCQGITGDAMYVTGGITLNTSGGTIGNDAWIIPFTSTDTLYPKHLRLDNWWTKTGGTFQPGQDAVSGWYNGSEWTYDAGSTGTSGSAILWQHDVCAQTITSRATLTTDAAFTGTTGVIDPLNGVMLLWYPDTTTSRKLHTVKLASPYTDTPITSLLDSNCSALISGGASAGTFWTQYPGMAWNPDKGVIGVYPSYGQDFWEINLATNACTHVTLGGDTIPTAAFGSNGTFGRLQYDTNYHIYILAVTDITKQAVAICTQSGGCTPTVANNFASRSVGTNVPGGTVVRAINFDVISDYPNQTSQTLFDTPHLNPLNGSCPGACNFSKVAILNDATAADGAGYLSFTIPSAWGGDYGSFEMSFNDASTVNHVGDTADSGQPHEMCYQYRYRGDDNFFNTRYYTTAYDSNPADTTLAGGWKQSYFDKGDILSGSVYATSCEPEEVNIQNTDQLGEPQAYHSCGAKDNDYEGLRGQGFTYLGWTDKWDQNTMGAWHYGTSGPPYPSHPIVQSFQYYPGEWMTFEQCVKVGTWYVNMSGSYNKNSQVRIWAARENQDPKLIISFSDYDLVHSPNGRYGKIWFAPYHTNKSQTQVHPQGKVDYDDLIIAKRFIPFPGVRKPNPPDQLAVSIFSSTRMDLTWRDNSSDETGFKVDRCDADADRCWGGDTGTSWVQIGTAAANATGYSATGLLSAHQYTFRVRSYNGYGDSPHEGGTCWWPTDNPCYGTATTP
jgi:hypothetical protein